MQIDEIRKLTDEELQKSLEDSQRSLMNLKFRKATMQLTNVVEIKSVRKDIRNILNDLITDAGYSTRVAANFNQAFNYIKNVRKK